MVHDDIVTVKVFSFYDNSVRVDQNRHVEYGHIGTKDEEIIANPLLDRKEGLVKVLRVGTCTACLDGQIGHFVQ